MQPSPPGFGAAEPQEAERGALARGALGWELAMQAVSEPGRARVWSRPLSAVQRAGGARTGGPSGPGCRGWRVLLQGPGTCCHAVTPGEERGEGRGAGGGGGLSPSTSLRLLGVYWELSLR